MPRVYDVKIYKSFGVRNLKAAWANTYQMNAIEDITDNSIQDMINALVGMEQTYHTQPVQFLHAVCSTKMNEPQYTPESLKVFELQGTGNVVVPEGEQVLDLNISLKMKKGVAFGRSGTMFYRGCLRTIDVSVNDRGESQLRGDSLIMTPGTWANAFNLVNNLAQPTRWIMAGDVIDVNQDITTQVRNVLSFVPSGVSINKRDHRYFDRAAAAGVPNNGG